MANLADVVKDPSKRKAVIDDCASLIDAEVHDKHGFSGAAIKLAYATVKNVRPGTIEHALDGLLDDFSGRIDPFWARCQTENADPRGFFTKNKSEVANALLGITDDRAKKTPHKVLKSAYEKLRPQAVDHIGAAMPRFADLVKKHAS